MFMINFMEEKNHEIEMDNSVKKFQDEIFEINKKFLKEVNHPAYYVISNITTLKNKLQKIGRIDEFYQKDFLIGYKFISFMISLKFKSEGSIENKNNIQRNHIWSPVITTWISSALLINGDFNKKTTSSLSCDYHGSLSEHDAVSCIYFIASNEKKLNEIEEGVFQNMISKFLKEGEKVSGLSNDDYFHRIYTCLEDYILMRSNL